MLFFDQEWLIFRQISPHRINFLQTIYNLQIHFWTNPVLEKTEHNFQVDAQSVVVVLRRCLYPHFIRFEQLDTSLERMLAEKYMPQLLPFVKAFWGQKTLKPVFLKIEKFGIILYLMDAYNCKKPFSIKFLDFSEVVEYFWYLNRSLKMKT